MLEELAEDYSKYCDVNIEQKLNPISKSVDDMLARLEEFQTMLTFIKQDEKDSSDILNSIPNYKNDFDAMCNTIDRLENLMTHIKINLDKLDDDLERAETELGYNEPKKKVTNLFTPLFFYNYTYYFQC
ncbi:hypothetical protein NQ317_009236 [Molorchus minor]|uniref:Biogenesis of lysosome-related organelles complex 1 subunit 2 n=1 Tax=Molorchus minor TaxID=1323400 RepID=A0ABQ9J468_9CUCU|nr:hypothetical protein NQ317_009236 [Molorchus minor]